MVNYRGRSMSNLLNAQQTLPIIDSRETDWTRILWVAVLERAVHDAFFQNDFREAKISLAWLDRNNKDFRLVCEFAGKDPDYIIRKLYVKKQARKKFFKNIHGGTNFWEAQKQFEKDMKWNRNLPKRV